VFFVFVFCIQSQAEKFSYTRNFSRKPMANHRVVYLFKKCLYPKIAVLCLNCRFSYTLCCVLRQLQILPTTLCLEQKIEHLARKRIIFCSIMLLKQYAYSLKILQIFRFLFKFIILRIYTKQKCSYL